MKNNKIRLIIAASIIMLSPILGALIGEPLVLITSPLWSTTAAEVISCKVLLTVAIMLCATLWYTSKPKD